MKLLKFIIPALVVALAIGCSRPNNNASGDQERKFGSRTILQNTGSDTLLNVSQAWAETTSLTTPSVSQSQVVVLAPASPRFLMGRRHRKRQS